MLEEKLIFKLYTSVELLFYSKQIKMSQRKDEEQWGTHSLLERF